MSVPLGRDDDHLTDDEVLERVREDGFELVERTCAGEWVHGWARGDDERWPCFFEQRQAISWMRDPLSRGLLHAAEASTVQLVTPVGLDARASLLPTCSAAMGAHSVGVRSGDSPLW